MNWLANTIKFRRIFKPELILLIPVFLGCDSVDDVGTEFSLENNVDVKTLEFDLPSTNLYLDSLRTDGESRLLVGSYTDALAGSLTAESYFHYGFTSGDMPADTLEYDSIRLSLAIDRVLPAVGTSTIELNVYLLADTILANVVYLSSFEQPRGELLGSVTKQITPEDSVISIKLNDLYGQGIFNFNNTYPDSVFSHFYGGLVVAPGPASTGLALIDSEADSSRLIIYSSRDLEHFTEYDFPVTSHTKLDRDRGPSPFSAIVEKEDFDLPDGSTVFDPLAGLTTSFNIEAVEEFFANNPNILINNAHLDIVAEGFADRDTLEGFHVFFRKDDGGILGPAILQNQFSGIMMQDDAYVSRISNPATVLYNDETDMYISRPTLFFQSLYNNYQSLLLDDIPDNEMIFLLEPTRGDTIPITDMVLINPEEFTLDQIIFNESSFKLRIFYTEVN